MDTKTPTITTMITNTIRLYLLRFYKEILCYWLISFLGSWCMGKNNVEKYAIILSSLELIALVWITVRIVLAEEGFRMSGGWKVRPHRFKFQHFFSIGLAALVITIAITVRAVVLCHLFQLSVEETWNLIMKPALSGWIRWVAFAGSLKLFGMLLLTRLEGNQKAAAWAVLIILLCPLTINLCKDYAIMPEYRCTGGSNFVQQQFAFGIKNQITDAKNFLGYWIPEGGNRKNCNDAKQVLALRLDGENVHPQVKLYKGQMQLKDERVQVLIHISTINPELIDVLAKAVPVLRFQDGNYSIAEEYIGYKKDFRTPFLSTKQWIYTADFLTPMALPAFEGDKEKMLKGLELRFYVPDENKIFEIDPEYLRENRLTKLQPKSRDELFSYFPWSDDDFDNVVLPFLIKNCDEADKEFLLGKLAQDLRLLSLFEKKGWLKDAMPLLKQRAKEHLDIDMKWLMHLVKEGDTELNRDLMVITLNQLNYGDFIEKIFRNQPGVDWSAFSKEAWRRVQYPLKRYGNLPWWTYAFWAAQEGEVTALRKIVEEASKGKKWENEKLKELVISPQENVLEYVQLHLDDLKYNPEKKQWQ